MDEVREAFAKGSLLGFPRDLKPQMFTKILLSMQKSSYIENTDISCWGRATKQAFLIKVSWR